MQLYLGFPAAAGEPPQQLKGFEKVSVAAGKTATVTFPIEVRDLSIWDVQSHGWSAVKGEFSVTVGTSSRDANALKGTLVN